MPINFLRATSSAVCLALIVGASLVLGGCSGASSDPQVVHYAISHRDTLLSRLPMYVAEEKGYFKKNDVKIDFINASGGGTTFRLLSTGNADMAEGGLSAAILAAKTDPNIELIGDWDHSANAMSWLAYGENVSADSIKEMKGVKLGYSHSGSASQRLLQLALKRAGIEGVELVSVGSMGENWTASKGGVITAGWAMEPFISSKLGNEGGKIVFRPGDYIKHFYIEGISVNKEFAQDNGDRVKGVLKSLSEGIDFVKRNPEEAAEIGAKHYHVDRQDLLAGIKRYLDDGVWNMKTDPKAFQVVVESMVANGYLDQEIDVGALLNQEYLPERFRTEFQ